MKFGLKTNHLDSNIYDGFGSLGSVVKRKMLFFERLMYVDAAHLSIV